MGVVTKIKIGAAVLLVLAGLLAWWRISGLEADNARLEQAAEVAAIEARGLRREVEANRAALERREEQRAELAAQTEALRHELDDLYRNNEPCATWADSDIPGPVLDRLRK